VLELQQKVQAQVCEPEIAPKMCPYLATEIPKGISTEILEGSQAGLGKIQMRRKGPQKYSNKIIQSAIAKYEGGAKLSAIARELDVEKSTVKYWLDNASKFLPEAGSNPAVARIGMRATRESWDIIFTALKEIKRKLSKGTIRDLILVVGELFEIQARIGALTGRRAMPAGVFEKSEEVRITVQKYMQKKTAGMTTEISQSDSTMQQDKSSDDGVRIVDAEAKEKDANGATS